MTLPSPDPGAASNQQPKRLSRPRIIFRVGVSGATNLPDPDGIATWVDAVLADITDHVAAFSRARSAGHVYNTAQSPLLRVISPLADGADRLVARQARRLGFQLDVALPFPEEAYETTFGDAPPGHHAANVREFQDLLAQAGPRILTLDGVTDDTIDRHRGYEAVGRLIVRNCDLLIAIWDDNKPSRGPGGTADTVQFALRAGVPVWWIDATGVHPPRWLQDTLMLPRLGHEPDPPVKPRDALRDYIARVILPPDTHGEAHPSLWDRSIACLRNTFGIQADPLRTLLDEPGLPNHQLWDLHRIVSDWVKTCGGERHARRTGQPIPARPARKPGPRRTWPRTLQHCVCAPFRRGEHRAASSIPAGLSRLYQHRYRTSYLMVFTLGAVALISAVIGLVFGRLEKAMTVIEMIAVAAILVLVVVNALYRWQERYMSYRMMGELLRLSKPLHALGWSLAGSRVNNMAHSTRRYWVAWLFAALDRAEPMQTGVLRDSLAQAKAAIIDTLLDEQISFHHRREIQCNGAARLCGQFGQGLFFAALVLVMLRVVLWASGVEEGFTRFLSLACALLPALSAAVFGLRAYEEFEVLAEQSEEMHEALRRTKERIERVRLDRPVASQVLAEELFDAATIMLSDVEGWAQLFRLKAVEA